MNKKVDIVVVPQKYKNSQGRPFRLSGATLTTVTIKWLDTNTLQSYPIAYLDKILMSEKII